jgi:NAD(P)-dependent dehydrogenase (short-subunit alcohol dehydrogenase family)
VKHLLSTKNVLIIGGNSSLGIRLASLATKDGFKVYASTRNLNTTLLHSSTSEFFFLDLASKDSIDLFLKSITNLNFSHIYILIGKLSDTGTGALKYESIDNYIKTYVVNMCYLIDNVLNKFSDVNNSRLVFMSSRAASKASHDSLYSISKSSVASFIRSRSLALPSNCAVVSVESGLIIESKMFSLMRNDVERHMKLSGGRLLTIDEFAKQLWKLDFQFLQDNTGRTIHIGPVY